MNSTDPARPMDSVQAVHSIAPTAPHPFFGSKRAAAVLKHAILSSYLVPFVSKTGSTSPDRRVVVVDGFAGAGRYEDGRPGSPALIAEAARSNILRQRRVECYFVEQHRPTYDRLRDVLAEEQASPNMHWEARFGTIEDHLDGLLSLSQEVPLFIFLDPFGINLPLDVVTTIFTRRPNTRPATEVLFRFDAGAIRRIRGVLHASGDPPSRAAQLRSLDTAAGGSWWRDEDNPALNSEAYIAWFEHHLLEMLCQTAHCVGWSTGVRQRPGVQVAYLLVFLTRHFDGFHTFGESLSVAQERWRREVFDLAFSADQDDPEQALESLDRDSVFAHEEEQLARQWQQIIERNIIQVLRDHEHFIIRDKWHEIYAGIEGLAREKHLRQALKNLHHQGLTSSNGTGNLLSKNVIRAAPPTQRGAGTR